MKEYEVKFRPLAEADLLALYNYIAQQAGRTVAGRYIERIEAACMGSKLSRRGEHGGTTFCPACAQGFRAPGDDRVSHTR